MRLTWPDNTGSVGWTSFHGRLTAADMDTILAAVPDARFSVTDYVAWDRIRGYVPEAFHSDWTVLKLYMERGGKSSLPFYINVREEDAARIVALSESPMTRGKP